VRGNDPTGIGAGTLTVEQFTIPELGDPMQIVSTFWKPRSPISTGYIGAAASEPTAAGQTGTIERSECPVDMAPPINRSRVASVQYVNLRSGPPALSTR
jgi:hypothetical protein